MSRSRATDGAPFVAALGLPVVPLLRRALARTGRARLVVSGTSMQPLLRPGDEVEIERRPPDRLRPGDIVVLATRTGDLVIHRYLRHEGMRLLCRGDATRSTDPLWHPDDCLGVAVARHRRGRGLALDRGMPRLGGVARGLLAELRRRVSRYASRG